MRKFFHHKNHKTGAISKDSKIISSLIIISYNKFGVFSFLML